MIRILIADDHKMFVDGIDSILAGQPDIEVVGRCFDGYSIFETLYKQQVDLLLLDVNLPKLTGIEVCKRMTKEHPQTKVLALSMYNEESFVTEIINNGAAGYILKNTGRSELLNAIRLVMEGKSYFSNEVTQTIMRSFSKKPKQKESSHIIIPKISRREKEVLALIVEEHTTFEIAEKLFISQKTVESHRSNLLSKLNARNSAGLVRMAIEYHLLD